MQQNWQRRHQFVDVEETTISSMLQPVFPGRALTSLELLTAGLCNTNYKFTVAGLAEAFVLRIYVREQEACSRDQAIFKLVAPTVPVPELLYADPASNYTDVAAYSVMRWVEGSLYSDILASGEQTAITAGAHAIGQVLAEIGKYTFPQAGFFGPDLSIAYPFAEENTSYLATLETFLLKKPASQRLGPEVTERLWELVTKHAHYLDQQDDLAALVHSDFKGFNILVRPHNASWQVAAVLDWEFAFSGSPLTDIGNMLRYEHLYPPAFAQQFIQGYQERGGKLALGWKQSTKLLDLISLCEFLNSPNPSNALIEEVTGLITHMLEHWEDFG